MREQDAEGPVQDATCRNEALLRALRGGEPGAGHLPEVQDRAEAAVAPMSRVASSLTVLSINANRRLTKRLDAYVDWLATLSPDVLLVQEPGALHLRPPAKLGPLLHVASAPSLPSMLETRPRST